VPRYMNLMRTRGLDIPQPSSSIKHDNAAAVTKPYPGDHDGGTPPSVSLGRESDAIVQKNSGSHTCATVADVGQDVTLSTEVDATVGHVDELDLGDRTVSVFKPNLERHSLMKVPPKRIMKSVGHAVKDWDMIKEVRDVRQRSRGEVLSFFDSNTLRPIIFLYLCLCRTGRPSPARTQRRKGFPCAPSHPHRTAG